jgi:hypothetical protein
MGYDDFSLNTGLNWFFVVSLSRLPLVLLQTRREYVHVGSGAASMRHTVLHNPNERRDKLVFILT